MPLLTMRCSCQLSRRTFALKLEVEEAAVAADMAAAEAPLRLAPTDMQRRRFFRQGRG